MDENNITTKTTTYLLNNIWKFYGFFLSFISDQGPQFISGFWKNLYKNMSIKVNLSIVFHLDTDDQNKIGNLKIKRHFYIFVNY